MTRDDYLMTMTRVRIADLKARLSEHLRQVRRGHEITVLDRDTPVARMVPVERERRLSVREPRRRYGALREVPLPRPVALAIDVLELLRAERQGER